MIDLNGMKTSELVALYNEHSGKAPITKWKRKVTELVAAVLKLKPDLFFVSTHTFDEASQGELAAQSGRPVDADETVVAAPTKSKKKAKAKSKAKGETDRGAIRRFCEELLLKTRGTDPETKRPMGLPYSDILAKVAEKFPSAETSLNCLRWYATKMNKRTGAEKVQMPVRPKAKPEAAAA